VSTFTIDPEDAKDFDDAISFGVLKNGHYEVGVHIADVSHYVQEGSALDREGYERATATRLFARELTVGETRDTNAGDLARDLTRRGVVVGRISALPDDLAAVTAAFEEALTRADLVVSTGGLGPTPDDLTREAIAALAGETPAVPVEKSMRDWLARSAVAAETADGNDSRV